MYRHLAKCKIQDKEKRHFVLLTFLSMCQGVLKRGQSLRKIKRMPPFIVSSHKNEKKNEKGNIGWAK
jgi:hypothetical protein